ncbi:hypothetical protein [Solibacillus sp. CAU 1738]|uniref:hypothetical protein n=1 Tax=Solibacillus sp. CAU 1738 TaxID=3140363 RepID=UPI00326175D1
MLLAVITSIVSAIWLAGSLKILHYFSLIDWHPVGFTKKWDIAENAFSSWMILILLLFIGSLILYLLMQYSWKVPAFLTSLVIGVAIAIVAEWIIYDLPAENESFQELSIPFIIIVVITCRFIIETAKFHYRTKNVDSRNKLMYKDSMIK